MTYPQKDRHAGHADDGRISTATTHLALESAEITAARHRSSFCESAVGWAIHTARLSLRKSVRIPFLAYQIRLTSSEKCRKRKANSDSKYCEDM
ncbi:MAG: hypothetical protein WCO71_08395, partial [Pseudomonadota bacterium]